MSTEAIITNPKNQTERDKMIESARSISSAADFNKKMTEQERINNPALEGEVISGYKTKSPDIFTSDLATKYQGDIANYITQVESDAEKLKVLGKEQLEAGLTDIEASYKKLEERAKEQYKETEASADVAAFRLGQRGTFYDVDRKEKQAKKKLDYFNALEGEKQSKINQLRSAYQVENYKAADALRKDIMKLQQDQYTFLQKDRQDKLTEIKGLDEEARKKVSDILPIVSANLTGDQETDLETIQDFAEDYGLDQNQLISGLISYRTEEQKESILNASNMASLLSKTEEGGDVNIPGLGQVKILGKEGDAPKTLSAGGKIYNYTNGKWTDTGIADSDFTPTNIMKALESLGEKDTLRSYISQSLGIPLMKSGGSVSFRHNNPHNIKFGDFAAGYGATKGQEATDGGYFAIFPDTATANQASKDLLRGPAYADLNFEDAMRKWSGQGYGADVSPSFTGKKMSDFNDSELQNLLDDMQRREGWEEGATSGEGSKYEQFANEQIALSVLPATLRNSNEEREYALMGIRAGLELGKTPYEVADAISGYKIDEPDDFSQAVRGYMSISEKMGPTTPAEFARLINQGNKSAVVKKLERLLLSDSDALNRESASLYAKQKGDDLTTSIEKNLKELGIVKGNWNKFKKKFAKEKNFQKIESDMTALITDWRLKMAGSNVTEGETKFLDSLIADAKDNPWNAMIKIKSFQDMQIDLLNAERYAYGIPKVEWDTLSDLEKRTSLYESPTITVRRKSDGVLGTISEEEFDENLYIKEE